MEITIKFEDECDVKAFCDVLEIMDYGISKCNKSFGLIDQDIDSIVYDILCQISKQLSEE